jgi:hypothetical protein
MLLCSIFTTIHLTPFVNPRKQGRIHKLESGMRKDLREMAQHRVSQLVVEQQLPLRNPRS